jgi:hypothetical protein
MLEFEELRQPQLLAISHRFFGQCQHVLRRAGHVSSRNVGLIAIAEIVIDRPNGRLANSEWGPMDENNSLGLAGAMTFAVD